MCPGLNSIALAVLWQPKYSAVSTSTIGCLERLVSERIYYVLNGMWIVTNSAHFTVIAYYRTPAGVWRPVIEKKFKKYVSLACIRLCWSKGTVEMYCWSWYWRHWRKPVIITCYQKCRIWQLCKQLYTEFIRACVGCILFLFFPLSYFSLMFATIDMVNKAL